MRLADVFRRDSRRPDRAIEIAETAAELWPALVEKAGLTGRHGRATGRYDQELIYELRRRLFPLEPESATLGPLLARSDLSAEALLRAFFEVVAPFSRMKADIFAMLTEAGATGSEASLPVMFQFREDDIFNQFRKAAEIISEQLVDVPTIEFSGGLLWDLVRAGDRGAISHDAAPPPGPPSLAEWMDDRATGGAYRRFPDGLLDGFGPPYAPEIARVIAVFNLVLDAFSRHGPDPAALARHRQPDVLSEPGATGMSSHDLSFMESDGWSVRAAEWIARRIADLHATRIFSSSTMRPASSSTARFAMR